jgi:hypothetical protein
VTCQQAPAYRTGPASDTHYTREHVRGLLQQVSAHVLRLNTTGLYRICCCCVDGVDHAQVAALSVGLAHKKLQGTAL